MILLCFFCSTVSDSVWIAVMTEENFFATFVVIFAEVFGFLLLALFTGFGGFHIWLATNALTTVEFCEKNLKKSGYNSKYTLGLYSNICAVLGNNPLLWFVPVALPQGDGCTWAVVEDLLLLPDTPRLEKKLIAVPALPYRFRKSYGDTASQAGGAQDKNDERTITDDGSCSKSDFADHAPPIFVGQG